MVRIVLFLLGCLLVAGPVYADIHASADCTLTNVQAAIDASATGDTVTLPACASEPAWSGAATVTGKNITIQGNGKTSTVLTRSSGYIFDLGDTSTRLTAIGITVTGTADNAVREWGQGWRVDHCQFNNYTGDSRVFVYAGGRTGWQKGLVDSNLVYNGRVLITDDGSTTRPNDKWFTAATLGDDNAVYVEDNTFVRTDDYDGNFVDANQGGRYVARYNTVYGVDSRSPNLLAHGVQSAANRGTRTWEVYGNTIVNPAGYAKSSAMWFLAGTGVVFNNSYTGLFTQGVFFSNLRVTDPDTTINNTTAGTCDGDNTADGNQDSYGYPCRDQIGMGIDASLFTREAGTYITTNAGAQTPTPAYTWGTYDDGVARDPVIRTDGSNNVITFDRNVFKEVAGFNGTTGMGCGTLAQMNAITPTVEGVGFWVTTQSCSDLTGRIGASPSTPISGTLYKNVGGTWTSYYTPYTYPHPLRGNPPVLTETTPVTTPSSDITPSVTVSSTLAASSVSYGGSCGNGDLSALAAGTNVITYSLGTSPGTYSNCTITATGAEGSSTPLNLTSFTVTGPTTTLTAPSAGNILGTVSVSATCTHSDGCAGLRFYRSGVPLAAEDTSEPYTYSWDTTGTPNGNYSITAVGRATGGSLTTSSPVAVTVQNPVGQGPHRLMAKLVMNKTISAGAATPSVTWQGSGTTWQGDSNVTW